jgi:hypothetical protein
VDRGDSPEGVIPDFFIAGTMKGGTTALHDFVPVHPAIAPAKQKEIHYFSLYPYRPRSWYLSHFSREDRQLTFDASPSYFDTASTDAIPRSILALNPEARIIVITRDPVVRALSHFRHLCEVNGYEPLVGMTPDEFFSHPFESCVLRTDPVAYYLEQVLSFSAYAHKTMVYLEVFGPERVLFLENRALREEPQETMAKVFRHLGLDPIESTEFETFEYSSGTSIFDVSEATRERLSNFFAEDYRKYCELVGLPFRMPGTDG